MCMEKQVQAALNGVFHQIQVLNDYSGAVCGDFIPYDC